jgi:hypothetical protein
VRNRLFVLLGALAILSATLMSAGCGESKSTSTPTSTSAAYTYATTSAIGDFAKWTIDSSVTPHTFSVVWNVTDTSGNIAKTMNISGTCGDLDATYHYRTCTVASSSDTNVQVGGQYQIMEMPGVALFVHPTNVAARGSGTGKDEIHIGFTVGACPTSSGAGDYVFTRVLPVANPSETEMLGLYRLSPSFISNNANGDLLHAGFAVEENGASFNIIYNLASGPHGSQDQGSFNGVDTFTGSCTNGVITMTQASNNMHQRGVVTSSGMMFFDGPEDFGGIVSAKTSVAATIDDLAGKSLIIVWQNGAAGTCSGAQGCTDLIRATFGAKDSTGKVTAAFTSLAGSTIPSMGFRAASDANAGSRFTSVNSGYSNNALSLTYPQPANIPGVLYSDEVSGGNETPTLLVIAKVNGKLLAFGNNTTRNSPGPCLNGAATCDRASGNFVGFEP